MTKDDRITIISKQDRKGYLDLVAQLIKGNVNTY